MQVRPFAAPEPAFASVPGEPYCTYLVAYEGEAEDLAAAKQARLQAQREREGLRSDGRECERKLLAEARTELERAEAQLAAVRAALEGLAAFIVSGRPDCAALVTRLQVGLDAAHVPATARHLHHHLPLLTERKTP